MRPTVVDKRVFDGRSFTSFLLVSNATSLVHKGEREREIVGGNFPLELGSSIEPQGSLFLIDGERRIVIHLRNAQGRTVMDS